MLTEYVPCTVFRQALDALVSVGKDPDEYRLSVEDKGDHWSVYFLPGNPRMRGGDVEVLVAKDKLEVLEIVRYQ